MNAQSQAREGTLAHCGHGAGEDRMAAAIGLLAVALRFEAERVGAGVGMVVTLRSELIEKKLAGAGMFQLLDIVDWAHWNRNTDVLLLRR